MKVGCTFCGNTSLQADVILGSSTYQTCTQDKHRPWTKSNHLVSNVDMLVE